MSKISERKDEVIQEVVSSRDAQIDDGSRWGKKNDIKWQEKREEEQRKMEVALKERKMETVEGIFQEMGKMVPKIEKKNVGKSLKVTAKTKSKSKGKNRSKSLVSKAKKKKV